MRFILCFLALLAGGNAAAEKLTLTASMPTCR